MALKNLQIKYWQKFPQENLFYARYYPYFLYGLMGLMLLTALLIFGILYQLQNRPLPVFSASEPDGKQLMLTAAEEPNLLSSTILRWAAKAATTAYTFDFANYTQQLNTARPYFTATGWQDYLASVDSLISTIVQNQLLVNGVVAGTPVIANQGPLPGKGYTWRVQIPFLVTYQSANVPSQRNYLVQLTIVRVPTAINPQGIGIDQFIMV